jgi:hypothetical protein
MLAALHRLSDAQCTPRGLLIARVLFMMAIVSTAFGVGIVYADWLWSSGQTAEAKYQHGLRMHYWRQDQPK